MPEQMSATQQERFVRSMQDQGVAVTRTTKGFFLRLPNGESTTVHFTLSDVRAQKNLYAVLRRAGVRHPEDPKNMNELPESITESGQPAPRTRRSIERYVEDHGFPDKVAVLAIVKDTGMEHVTITRALYHMGFLPTKGKRGARDWLTPEEILKRKPKGGPVESQTFDPEPELEEQFLAAPDETTATPVPPMERREFLDSHDSWVVNLEGLPLHMSLGDYFDSIAASGLQFEIRVWR